MNAERLILVIAADAEAGERLRQSIEFLNAPETALVALARWREATRRRRLAAVFLHRSLPREETEEIVAELASADAALPIVLVGGRDIAAVESRYPRAKLYGLPSPVNFSDLAALLDEVRAGYSRHRLAYASDLPRSRPIGESLAMCEARGLVERIATTATPILIQGEPGTGKEVIARYIHELSGRRGPFVAVDCGVIPQQLLESELFGYERGAFTGAVARRPGRFEQADSGTVFLDRIDELPLEQQAKVLRVLQHRAIDRIGGVESTRVDVRIIAATRGDLPEAVEEGSFREDLFHALNAFPIELPPLCERTEDIPLLLAEMVRRVDRRTGVRIDFSAAARRALAEYAWPGNVRELAKLVERLATIRPHGTISPDDLPGPLCVTARARRASDNTHDQRIDA